MNTTMQFLFCLEMLEIMSGWAWTWSSKFESRKCDFELTYLIVVVFDMKSEFQLVGDHFKSIYGGLVVNLD